MDKAFNDGPRLGISLDTMRSWISWQLDKWEEWDKEQSDDSWLRIETGNSHWPTADRLLVHAFAPVRRYAERILGNEPFDDKALQADSFAELAAFGRECLAIHASASATFTTEQARAETKYQTRSAGEWTITPEEALVHALTHCYWHLGGVVHLLRANNIAPPQWNDLIFYAAGLHEQDQSASQG